MFNSIKCHNFTYLNIDVCYDIAEILLGHVKLIIWFSDTDFQKNDEGGRVFNFCIYMHIGPIFKLHKSFTVVPSVIFTINHG